MSGPPVRIHLAPPTSLAVPGFSGAQREGRRYLRKSAGLADLEKAVFEQLAREMLIGLLLSSLQAEEKRIPTSGFR
jgi:hypothetical protein